MMWYVKFAIFSQGKSNPALCLEGFHQLLLTMVTWFSNPIASIDGSGQQMMSVLLHDFLVHVNPALRDKEPGEVVHHFIKFLEVHVHVHQ